MRLTVNVTSVDDEALHDPHYVAKQALKHVIARLGEYPTSFTTAVRDSNGNLIGEATFQSRPT
jgi:hypothetical protein